MVRSWRNDLKGNKQNFELAGGLSLYRTVTERVTSKHKHRHQWCLSQFDGRIEEASFLLFTLRWFFTGISWFSEDHENLIPRKLSVSLFWVHYLICFPTAHRQVSVYQGRVSIMYWRTVYMISIHRVMYKLTTWEPKFRVLLLYLAQVTVLFQLWNLSEDGP